MHDFHQCEVFSNGMVSKDNKRSKLQSCEDACTRILTVSSLDHTLEIIGR